MKLRNTIFSVQHYLRFKTRSISFGIAFLLFLSPFSANAYEMGLGAGEVSSISYFSGRILSRIISSELPDATCKTKATNDIIDHLTNTQNGSLDLAIVDSQMLFDASMKAGLFQYVGISYDNLTILTPLYDLPVGIIVRNNAKIKSVNDMRGRRINAGSLISREHQTVERIMAAKGWQISDFERFEELSSSYSQDTMAFCHNTVQIMLTIGVHPTLATQRLLRNCNAQLLNVEDADINKMVDADPALWKTSIAADTYPTGFKETRTFGSRAILIASGDMDEETAYNIVKAIYKNKNRFQQGHPAFSLYPVSTAKEGIDGLKMHPGAVRFFSEQ